MEELQEILEQVELVALAVVELVCRGLEALVDLQVQMEQPTLVVVVVEHQLTQVVEMVVQV